MLSDGRTRQADERGEPAERNPVVGHQSERGKVEPLRRLKVGLSGQPLIDSQLVKEEFAASATVPTARREFAGWRGKPIPPPPAAQAVVRPSVLGSPPPQCRGPGRESGIRFCGWHPPIIEYCEV